MMHSKKKRAGLLEREDLLFNVGFEGVITDVDAYPRTAVAEDDILDDCVACWKAARIVEERAIRIHSEPPRDGRGLCMEMWR
jgi:predicted RNase H-like nuclease